MMIYKNSIILQKNIVMLLFAELLEFYEIHYFENIIEIKNEQYKFPTFLFANAKAYLHYDKNK